MLEASSQPRALACKLFTSQLPTLDSRHQLCESKRTCPLCQKTLVEFSGQSEDSEEIFVLER